MFETHRHSACVNAYGRRPSSRPGEPLAGIGVIRRLVGVLILAAVSATEACAVAATSHFEAPRAARESVTPVSLHGKPFDLHLALPATLTRRDILVVYASGDGGWFGAATDMWRQIARAGYATAGFSSRALLRIERAPGSTLDPAQLAVEYGVIVANARQALGLPPDARVILAGWSRGAAFSVLVGANEGFHDTLGVLAIGLADGEDLTVDGSGDDSDDGNAAPGVRQWPFDTYALVSGLAHPCAVIQATHDNYFPAADAQRRFGPDTSVRRFYSVDARNHRFSGGKATFDAALLEALQWIASTQEPQLGASNGPRPFQPGRAPARYERDVR